MSFKNNFTLTPRGFLVNTAEPVDARFSVPNSESRLNIPTGTEGFTATQLYNGLLMFQKDTEELYLLLDKDNASLESSWKLIYPASGSTSDTGSLITASAAGNIIEFEKGNGDTFTVTVDTGSFDTSSLLITASAAGNVIEFEKGNGDTFTLTVDTGSFDTSSLLVTGSVNQNVLTFEKGNGDEFTLTVDTGSGGDAFPFTGSAEITGSLILTGSLITTGSVNLALETSSTAVDKVMMYDNSTGQVFITSSAAIGGSSVTFVGTASNVPGTISQTIQSIKTLDFNPNDALVQFDTSNGELTFIFGDPPSPTVGVGTSGYEVNKFNLETQSFAVTGTYNVFSNGFISASLKETIPDILTLEHTDINVGSLTRNFIDRTGSKATLGQPEYRFTMELTSSSPIDGSENKIIDSTTLTLNKLNPLIPTNTFDVSQISQFGGSSNIYGTKIEVGATGSISYTASKGADDRNYRFIKLTDASTSNPVTMAPSANGFTQISGSIDITTEPNTHTFQFKSNANYDSDNGPGATPNTPGDPLNDPLVIKNMQSSTKTYTRVRSIRAAAFLPSDTGSILSNPEDIDFWVKNGVITHTAGGITVTGQYFYGNGNPNPIGTSVEIANPLASPKYHHVLVHDSAYSPVVYAGGINFQSGFDITTVNNYKIYISKAGQGGIPNPPVVTTGQEYEFRVS